MLIGAKPYKNILEEMRRIFLEVKIARANDVRLMLPIGRKRSSKGSSIQMARTPPNYVVSNLRPVHHWV